MPEIWTKVKGVSYSCPLTGIPRQQLIKFLSAGMSLTPVREPNNPADTNAVALHGDVLAQRVHLGYLTKERARQVGALLDAGIPVSVTIANITGQFDTQGINLLIRWEELEPPAAVTAQVGAKRSRGAGRFVPAPEENQHTQSYFFDAEDRRDYQADRLADVQAKNAGIYQQLEAINAILIHALNTNNRIDFDARLRQDEHQDAEPPPELATPREPPQMRPLPPSSLFERLRRTRYEQAAQRAATDYELALNRWQETEAVRQRQLEQWRAERQQYLDELDKANRAIREFKEAYYSGDNTGIVAYSTVVLLESTYNPDFPRQVDATYEPETKTLTVDYLLPGEDIVPAVSEYRYIKSRDAVEKRLRPAEEIRELHQELIARIALRSIHELLHADQGGFLERVRFNGQLHETNPATGHVTIRTVIQIDVTSMEFRALDMSRVSPRDCVVSLTPP